MSTIRYALPVFGLAAQALAQCTASPSPTMTITDGSEIASCGTFSGSIALATGSTQVNLGSLQQISGDLIADQTNTSSIQGDSLQSIGGMFSLSNTLSLTSVSFGVLTRVKEVSWIGAPLLNSLSFGSGVQQINDFTIRDTGIQDMSQINLKSANTVNIAQNGRLLQLNWQLANITKSLFLDGNGLSGNRGFGARFPNLMMAGQISINNANELDFSSLQNATGLQIYSTSIQNMTLANLTSVGAQGLTIDSNTDLNNVSFPGIQSIGGAILITNNSALTGDISFPALTTVSSINAFGSFSSLSLPVINRIAGAVNVRSTNPNFDCSAINGLHTSGVTTAKPNCTAGARSGSGSGTSGTGTSSGSGSSTSTGAAARIQLGAASFFGATGLFAAIFGLL